MCLCPNRFRVLTVLSLVWQWVVASGLTGRVGGRGCGTAGKCVLLGSDGCVLASGLW